MDKVATGFADTEHETMPADRQPTFTGQSTRAIERDNPFTVQTLEQFRRTLVIGNTLKRRRKGDLSKRSYPWAIVRDVIKAAPAPDTSQYLAVLCEGIGGLAGQWFVYRTYFTNNRHGNLHYGQFGPQAPFAIDKWITDQIIERGWYEKVPI
jgi:hypothetical protein